MDYWGTEDTSIHFCEDKYKESPIVAEYYNTISSLYYIVIGSLFLTSKISHLGRSLIMVGIGAFCLHMTLRYYAQMLDETAMLIISFDIIRYLKKNTISRWLLLPLIILYIIFHNYFIYFFAIFALFQIYIIYIGLQNVRSGTYQKICIIGYTILFCVGTICWLCDQFLCEYVKEYQMHAYWHMFTAFATGCGFLIFIV